MDRLGVGLNYWAALSLSFRLISNMLMNIIAWGPQVRSELLVVVLQMCICGFLFLVDHLYTTKGFIFALVFKIS